jgi:LEA14-like dessication related protein
MARSEFFQFEFPQFAFRRRGAHRLVSVSLLLLAGCAAFGPPWETPTVTVHSFRALPSGGALPEFEIGLEVVNPNRAALELAGVAYTISLDGREIIKGVGNDLPVIDGYGTGRVTLTASANLLAGVQLFTDLLRSPREAFEYRLEAKLDPGGLRPAIRISETGRISADALAR